MAIGIHVDVMFCAFQGVIVEHEFGRKRKEVEVEVEVWRI
jgi:hypothetical protein